LWFSAAAWGGPCLLTGGIGALNSVLNKDSPYNPGIGETSCFLSNKGNRQLIYFHVPVLVLMVANLLLYLLTIFYLARSSAQTVHVRKSRRENTRGRLEQEGEGGLVSREAREQLALTNQVLYTKMFLVLGLLWVFSMAHYILHGHHPRGLCHYPSNLEVFFRIVDSLNLLRGFFIFIIFVCKANVISKVKVTFFTRNTVQAPIKIVVTRNIVQPRIKIVVELDEM